MTKSHLNYFKRVFFFFKEKIARMNFIKIKIFYSMKDNIKKMKKQPSNWENIFEKLISDKGLVYKI